MAHLVFLDEVSLKQDGKRVDGNFSAATGDLP